MSQSQTLFDRAQQVIPGGVNSPVRAFNGVGGTPIFFNRGEGALLFDADGRQYIDYVGSWGPMITGHADPDVLAAIEQQIHKGLSFGAPTELEITMAEKVCAMVPGIEQVRMVNSGTEATMSAIRLARGFTNRDKLIKFEGCYHGHADSLLVKAGSGALTMGEPSSPGVPADFAQHTLTATFNDLDSVEQLFEQHKDEVACLIVEPIAGNMNCIPPAEGFLEGLRALCDQYGAVLIFDEVMCGFRVGPGGAQELYNVRPDLTTLGKVIGGGMPVGAFGGRADIMAHIAPCGPVYQAGTLSGNPVAMVAGLTLLEKLCADGFYQQLTETAALLTDGLQTRADAAGISFTTNQVGSMFGLFFSPESQISRFQQVTECNIERFKQFFHGMLEEGVYLAPSAYEAGFVGSAHNRELVQQTLDAAERVFARL